MSPKPAGRLSRVTDERDSLVESYQYDHEGRRLADIRPESQRGERRFSYGPANRLGQAGSAQYGHDRAGFRSLKVERTALGDAETRYHYEPSGLLLHVDLPGGRRIQYVHDSSGLRIEKRVDGRVVEAYRWLDPLRLSEFHDGSRWWRFAYLEGRTPVGLTDGERSYFLRCDQLGTPLALATPDGHVVQAMQYDSFGNLLAQRGDAVRLPLGFAGGLFDADTGLTRFVWRDYDAATGRFTALDPLREKGGDTDFYGYCVDDPVNRVDVWGLVVEFCERPNEIPELKWTGIKHHWLKTGLFESGQGEVGRGIPGRNGDSGGLFVDTEWVDHTGQSKAPSAKCWPVTDVDENCVIKLIKPGTPSGIWVPGANDCHEQARDVLNYCRTDVE